MYSYRLNVVPNKYIQIKYVLFLCVEVTHDQLQNKYFKYNKFKYICLISITVKSSFCLHLHRNKNRKIIKLINTNLQVNTSTPLPNGTLKNTSQMRFLQNALPQLSFIMLYLNQIFSYSFLFFLFYILIYTISNHSL